MHSQISILKMQESQLKCKQRASISHNNKLKEKYFGNEALQEVRISNRIGSHLSCFRCNVHDSDKHIYTMFKRWLEYKRLGVPVLTEAIFNNGQRADIFLPSLPLIEEIMVTETDERFEKKDYPFQVKKIKVPENYIVMEQ